jgi:hypothetical protein
MVVSVPGRVPVDQKLSSYIIKYQKFFKIIFNAIQGQPYQAFEAVLIGLSEAPKPLYPTDAITGPLGQSGLCRTRRHQREVFAPRLS